MTKLIAVKVLGVTTDTSICQCCGKVGLKKTVAILFEDGQVLNYGTTCAAKAFPKMKSAITAAIDTATRQAGAEAYILKWVANGAPMNKIADCVAVSFCGCWVKNGTFVMNLNGVAVSYSPIG